MLNSQALASDKSAMLNREQAKTLIQQATSATKYYAVAVLNLTKKGTTRFAASQISQNVVIDEGDITLTIYDGKKQVSCTTNDLTPAGATQLAKEAESMIEFVLEAEFGAFPFSTEKVTECISDGKLAQAFGVVERVGYIKEGVAGLQEGYTAAGALTLTRTVLAIGNGESFRYANYDNVEFNTVVSHTDGTDGAGQCVSYTGIPDIIGCFINAQSTAAAARNPVEPPLGGFTVVLSPEAFGDLVTFMTMTLNAKAVEDGVSFARGKLGEKIFGENLTITDDVTHAGLCPLPFDVEGNPRRVLPLVDKGVVKAFVYDNKLAAKHNVESTGHALKGTFFAGAYPTNVVVEGGDMSIEEIIADTKNGIFINEFHYTNFVNPRKLQLTGLTRNGTFLIEDGKVTKPIGTVRFTQSLIDAFNNITAISKEREIVSSYGALRVPAVRIENFHFTSRA